MLAIKIVLAVSAIGVGIGVGYAIPLSNQHDNSYKAASKEYDTRTTMEIYNELIGNSSRSINPGTANPRINITPRGNTTRIKLNPYAEIASAIELVENEGVAQPILGALAIGHTTGRATNGTKGKTSVTIRAGKSQRKPTASNKRRSIFQKPRNVGTKARARSRSRLSSTKSKIKQRTNRTHVAKRVNQQTMRDRTRFRKTGQKRRK